MDVYHFDVSSSDRFFFIFKFDHKEGLAQFVSSLLDKPFVRGLGKILGENAIFGYIYLPKVEFGNLIDTLSKLIKLGYLECYRYVIQHFQKASRQTISYEYFRGGSWTYDHQKHLQNLHHVAKETAPKK